MLQLEEEPVEYSFSQELHQEVQGSGYYNVTITHCAHWQRALSFGPALGHASAMAMQAVSPDVPGH